MHIHVHTHILNLTHTHICFHTYFNTHVYFLCGCMCLCMRVSLLRVWMETTLTHTITRITHIRMCARKHTTIHTHERKYVYGHLSTCNSPGGTGKKSKKFDILSLRPVVLCCGRCVLYVTLLLARYCGRVRTICWRILAPH